MWFTVVLLDCAHYLPNKDSVLEGVILNIATYSVVRDEITAFL